MFFEKEKICKNCGFIGKEKKKVRGTLSMELSLWVLGLILLIFPPLGILILIFALFYSLYRLASPKLEEEVVTYYMQKVNEKSPKFLESVNTANEQEENFNEFRNKLRSYFYDLDNEALFKSHKLKMCSFDLFDLFIRYHEPFFSIEYYKDCIFENYKGAYQIVAINNGNKGTLFTNYSIGGDIIFIYGDYKYRTNENLKEGFYRYTGRYTYLTVLGSENTVDSFKEIDFNKIPSNLYFLNKFYYN